MNVVVDTSAVMAILRAEPDAAAVREALAAAEERWISAASLVELGIVVESRTGGRITAERLVRDLGLTVVDFDERQAERALDAWRRFGKGRHRAGLNLGDCYSYALAEELAVGLVWVGDDFEATDVRRPRLEP